MDVTRAIAAVLVGAGVMVGGPAAAQGRPQDSYALANAPIPVPRAAVVVARSRFRPAPRFRCRGRR